MICLGQGPCPIAIRPFIPIVGKYSKTGTMHAGQEKELIKIMDSLINQGDEELKQAKNANNLQSFAFHSGSNHAFRLVKVLMEKIAQNEFIVAEQFLSRNN